MRLTFLAITVPLIVGLLMSAPCFAEEKSDTTVSDIKKKTEQAVETAKKYTAEKRQVYQKEMEAKLEDLSKRIGELKAKAGTATKDARAALDKQLEQLKSKQQDARKKLSELRASASSTWEKVKAKADVALQELQKAYEGARSLIK
jgi:hypothetical protein